MSRVRASCQEVVNLSTHVRIDEASIDRFTSLPFTSPEPWSAFEFNYTGPRIFDYVFALDALNFCFWPHTTFDYPDLALGLKSTLLADPSALSPQRLVSYTLQDLLRIFPENFPDLQTRLNKLHELGSVINTKFNGSYEELLKSSGNSALQVKFVEIMWRNFEGFRDVSQYKGIEVFLLKRAQILAADLVGSGCWKFDDLHELTMFPDYQVPQVLNSKGIMIYSEDLQRKIDNMEVIERDSEYEIEIRAATVIACDKIALKLNQPSVFIDWQLWQTGEREKRQGLLKNHHRTLTNFY